MIVMETSFFLRASLMALFISTVIGCSEDASDVASVPSVTYETFAGNPFTGEGIVTGFEGLAVDGIPYQIEGASMQDDEGQSITLAALEIGMRVHVQGKLAVSEDGAVANGFLSQVTVSDQVRGLLEWSDVARNVLKVNGQEILFDENTVFSGFAANSLQAMLLPGVQLSISGTYVAGDDLLASRISTNTASDGHAVLEGAITNSDSTSMEIRGITISYTEPDLNDYVVADNNNVKVTVENYNADSNTAALVSIKAVNFSQRTLNVDDSYVITGAIKNLNTSAGTLGIRQLSIHYASDTPIAFGDTTDITDNQVVSIRGQIKGSSVQHLEASHISIIKPYAHRIQGSISNMDTIDNGLVKNITIEGEEYRLTRQALIQNIKDGAASDVFNTLSIGDMVNVGYIDSNGTHLITKLQRIGMPVGEENRVIAHAQLKDITFNAANLVYHSNTFNFDTTDPIQVNQTLFIDHLGLSQTAADFKTYAETPANENREAVFNYDTSQTPFKLLSIHAQPLAAETVSFYMIKATDKLASGGTPATFYNLVFTKDGNSKTITISNTSGNFTGGTKKNYLVMSNNQSGVDSSMELNDIANDADLFTAIKDIANSNDVYVMLLLTWPSNFQIQGIYVFDKKEYINKFKIFEAYF
jgi:hypothetical protein